MKKFLTAVLLSILYAVPVYCGPLVDLVNKVQEIKKEQQNKINYPRVWNGYGLTHDDIYKVFISIGSEIGIELPEIIDLAEIFELKLSEKGYFTGADFKYMCSRDRVLKNKHECDIFVKTFADLEPKFKLDGDHKHGHISAWPNDDYIWSIETIYGPVRGGAACIETNYGVNISDMKKDLILAPGVNRGEYCWCQILEPFVSNWVHVADFSDLSDLIDGDNDWVPVNSGFAHSTFVHRTYCAYDGGGCSKACHRILENETITKMLTDYARSK